MDSHHELFGNIDGAIADIAYAEPMSRHTTFKIGGNADVFARPRSVAGLLELVGMARRNSLPFAVIGGGANLLVADSGYRGLVICTDLLNGCGADGEVLHAGAGIAVKALVKKAAELSLAGLEFAAGLPGSVGGAVYMNARCYEREMADVLASVEYLLPESGTHAALPIDPAEWEYKRTPFMPGGRLSGAIVTGATFRLAPGDASKIGERMRELEADRVRKGHFDFPSAGSLFKNDRAFGRPSGAILDELGFRGRRIGDAMVSPKHANIFVNAGSASAADMMALIREAQTAAKAAFGFDLECEVQTLGDFD